MGNSIWIVEKIYSKSFYYTKDYLCCKYQDVVYIELNFCIVYLEDDVTVIKPTNHLYEIQNVFAKNFAFVSEMHIRVLQKDLCA